MSIAATDHSQAHEIMLQLTDELYETAREAVVLGLAPSQIAFIEEAIRLRAREVRHARTRTKPLSTEADAPADRRGRRFIQGAKEDKKHLNIFLTDDPTIVRTMKEYLTETPIPLGVFLQKVLEGFFADPELFDGDKTREETLGQIANLDLVYSVEHRKRMPWRRTSVYLPTTLAARLKQLQEEASQSQAIVLYAALHHFFRAKKRR